MVSEKDKIYITLEEVFGADGINFRGAALKSAEIAFLDDLADYILNNDKAGLRESLAEYESSINNITKGYFNNIKQKLKELL